MRAAARWREALFGKFGLEPLTNAYRLVNGAGDGLEGLVVDACAGFLVVQISDAGRLPWCAPLESALEEKLHPRGIVRKLRYAGRERGRVEDRLVAGEAPPHPLRVLEEGLPFEVELLGGLHTGLFTDLREERARLRSVSRARRVLNTFAYTGSFSVAAVAGGASEVTSVDVVAKALERARRNFEAAGLDSAPHRFVCMEVLEYLRLAARRGWRFDAVVLDPPTFASFRSGRWSARTGYPDLLRLALPLLEPEGLLWVVANTEGMPPAHLEGAIARALRDSGLEGRTVSVGGLPPDYPTPAGQTGARYLKVHVLQIS